MKNRFVWLAALGHLFTDLNQGAVPALLPFFIAEYHLSYAAAAGLVAALSIASTVIQPLFGFYADRLSKPWLIPAGVAMAGCGVAFSTLLPDYWFAVAMIVLSGIGIAAFHPEGARLVHNHAGDKKATAMSVFAVGGQMGIALGPIMAAVVVSAWGLRGTAFLSIPFVLMAAFLAVQLTGKGGGPAAAKGAAGAQAGEKAGDQWGPFAIVTGVVIIRSIIFYGLNTFIPLYWIHVYQQSTTAAGTALSIMFGAGVAGTLWGGRLADTYGHRRTVPLRQRAGCPARHGAARADRHRPALHVQPAGRDGPAVPAEPGGARLGHHAGGGHLDRRDRGAAAGSCSRRLRSSFGSDRALLPHRAGGLADPDAPAAVQTRREVVK
ncbi:MAG: MFS transporter [Syntrophales bacterium]|nr:MFS transporter [Syntrophales bacterium]